MIKIVKKIACKILKMMLIKISIIYKTGGQRRIQ
jgi:hypothetical protein